MRQVQRAGAGRWSVSRAAGGTCSASMTAPLQALVHSPLGRWSLQGRPTDGRQSVQTPFRRRVRTAIAGGAVCRSRGSGRWSAQEVGVQGADINTRLDNAAAVSLPCSIPSFSLSVDEHEPRLGSAEMDGTAEAAPNLVFPSPSARASRALRRTSQWHRPGRPIQCGSKKRRGMVTEGPDMEPGRTIATVARRDEQAAFSTLKRATLGAAERSLSWTKAAPRRASNANLERRALDCFRASGSCCARSVVGADGTRSAIREASRKPHRHQARGQASPLPHSSAWSAMIEMTRLRRPAQNDGLSSQRQPRAAIHILESLLMLAMRTNAECFQSGLPLRKYPNAYLDNWAIAQNSKIIFGELRPCTTAQNGNRSIRQMRAWAFDELPACAILGFNRRELYGTIITMIRFTFNFGMAS